MEHQVRRGIYRQKAQRLSIALAPVAPHRSLLFNKVRADLASKASYSELSPTSNDSDYDYEAESPALFMLTPQPQKMSAIISAKSAVSMYSQASPFVANDNRRHAIAVSPSLQLSDLLKEGSINRARPLPTLPLRSAPLSALSRSGFEGVSLVPSPQRGLFESLTPTIETAIATAAQFEVPEVQANKVLDKAVIPKEDEVVPQAPPSKPLPIIKPVMDALDVTVKDMSTTDAVTKPVKDITSTEVVTKPMKDTPSTDTVTEPAKDAHVAPRRPLPVINVSKDNETKGIALFDDSSSTKRASKHTKTFGKVLSRISMHASKKEIAHRIRTDSISQPTPVVPPVPPLPPLPPLPSLETTPFSDEIKLTLPEVPKVEPIRTSFIAKVAARPITFAPAHASISEEEEGMPLRKKRLSPTEARDKERRRRTTMPPTPTSVKRSLEMPMLAVPPMALRPPPPRRPITGSLRRLKSSPTVAQFEGQSVAPLRVRRNRRWDTENMPPLPPLPPLPDLAMPIKLARPPVPDVPARTRSHSVGRRDASGLTILKS